MWKIEGPRRPDKSGDERLHIGAGLRGDHLTLTGDQADEVMARPKRLVGSIRWVETFGHHDLYEFRAQIDMDPPARIFLQGSANQRIGTFSFVVVCNDTRIRALDIGKNHRNPDGQRVGDKHKHRWTDEHVDRDAYVPQDITTGAPIDVVFREFLTECNIEFDGVFPRPPVAQARLWG